MHELPVTQNILEIALEHARKAQARRIASIYIVIGDMTSIVDDSVQFYWDMISARTPAEGARLEFRRVRAQLECRDCHQRYSPQPETLACPMCSGANVEVVAGREFYVEAIEVLEDEPQRV